MRIDYFVVSEKLKDRIVACEIHGKGIELQGASYFILSNTLVFWECV
jgi:hypothetical protein